MSLLVLIAILIVSLYTVILIIFSIALLGKNQAGDFEPEGSFQVSLVIPFRNEAEHLPELVNDLYSQTYPASLFQVIFVDDHSVDDSRKIVESLIADRSGFYCLALPENKNGKKEALSYGVQKAAYDWIIQVDADCRIGERFIASHISHHEAYPSDLVAGLVTTKKVSKRFMENFERLDLLSMGGVGAASFMLKRPMMCSGANLAYSKELYFQTRSYDPSGAVASGDDMFLMIGARKLGRSLSYMLSPGSVVKTNPVAGLSSFLRQRIRWGSKTVFYKQWDIQLLAILVALTNISLLLIPVWIYLNPQSWPGWLAMWSAKTLADGALLYHVSRSIKQPHIMKRYLQVSFAYYPIFLLIMIGSLFGQSAWKGRDSM
jgi:biofilm PGA synthesis N-glycosyltransferase PgaC